MKIKINQQELLNTLNILDKAINSKSVIESLKGIKIEVKEDEVIFTASKNSLAIIVNLNKNNTDLEIFETGSSIVSGIHFINVIKKLSASYINLETEGSILHIKSKKTHIQLNGYELDSYPLINFKLEEPINFNFKKELFHNIYNINKFSVSIKPIKPVFTGINFNFKEDYLLVTSTDSLRITYNKLNNFDNIKTQFTIGKNTMQDLTRICDYIEDEDLEFNISNNQLILKTNNVQVKARLLDGDYPDVEAILPKNTNFSYELDRKDILTALDRIVLLTDKEESVVSANVINNNLELKSNHKFLGGIEEFCSIKNLKGNPFEIYFDPIFVFEALQTIESDFVVFEFIDEVSGFLITDVENRNIINIISPIRIS